MVSIMALIANHGIWGDEGMWLFNAPPRGILKERYNFDATPEWLEHIQKSSVRFNSGGSGSFVSPDGLVLTNHHVGLDVLHKISSEKKNYVKDGFYARTQAEEAKSPDAELNVLMEIEDVTERVNAAVKPGMDPAEAQKARRAVMNTIQKESLDKTGMRSDVVTLFQGGLYHLYRFKKYTDVRLVFAPEVDIAFFGGDPDNFEYPRYDLDICLFRVYEDDKPAKIKHYLTWSEAGCKEGELVFVSGHPGRTNRLNTVNHLEFLRDVEYPLRLNVIRRREVLLKAFSDRSIENARRARDELFSYQNSRKARIGGLAGLQDPVLINRKREDEKALRAAVDRNPKLKAAYGDAWDMVATSIKELKPIFVDHYLFERGIGFGSELFQIARNLVRVAEENTKPNPERLPEYSEARLESLKQQLFSEAPIYEDLEMVKLADSLGLLMEMAGGDNEMVRKVLAGKSPHARAGELIRRTRLRDVAVRKKLFEGGLPAIEGSDDPMIQLARLVDPLARGIRKIYEDKFEEPQRQAYQKIANALFAVKGKDQYPDATFTLRLAFGEVKGYTENGKKIPDHTTMGGTYEHAAAHENIDPFALPKSWVDRKGKINLDTPFNFVSTPDIIGGNSGSPVVNRKGEFVGIIFDGNIESLVLDFIYEDQQARAVSVASQAIIEALRNIYDAGPLADELTGKRAESRR
jgi:hypothetical protein